MNDSIMKEIQELEIRLKLCQRNRQELVDGIVSKQWTIYHYDEEIKKLKERIERLNKRYFI